MSSCSEPITAPTRKYGRTVSHVDQTLTQMLVLSRDEVTLVKRVLTEPRTTDDGERPHYATGAITGLQ